MPPTVLRAHRAVHLRVDQNEVIELLRARYDLPVDAHIAIKLEAHCIWLEWQEHEPEQCPAPRDEG